MTGDAVWSTERVAALSSALLATGQLRLASRSGETSRPAAE